MKLWVQADAVSPLLTGRQRAGAEAPQAQQCPSTRRGTGTSPGGTGSPSLSHGSDDAAPKPATTHSRGLITDLQLLGHPNGSNIKLCV